MHYSHKFTAAAIIACLMSSTASAVDLDQVFSDDANYVKPAELGSGWYLRGEIGFNLDASHSVVATGSAVQGAFIDENFTDGPTFSIGAGYKFNNFLRADFSIGRLFGSDYTTSQLTTEGGVGGPNDPNDLIVDPGESIACNGWGEFIDIPTGTTFRGDKYIDNCIRTDSSEYDTIHGMANVYIDLPPVMGFQPFIGAGVGFGRTSWREEVGRYDCVPDDASVVPEGCRAYGTPDQPADNTAYTQPGVVSDGVDYRFGYSLAAGVAYQINPNLIVDTTYRYLDFGGSGSDNASGTNFADNGYSAHQVNVGLRYTLF